MEFYDPETRKHGQAHMQARSVISTSAMGFYLRFNGPFLVALALPNILSKAGSRGSRKSEVPTVIWRTCLSVCVVIIKGRSIR